MRNDVWTEVNADGDIVRIFKTRKAACAWSAQQTGGMFPGLSLRVPYSTAVDEIRHALFLRSKGECELCAAPVTEDSGHMHEQQHRGKGGEVSLANSVFICPTCHHRAHADRTPHFTKKPLTSE